MNWSKRNPSFSKKRRHIRRLTGTMSLSLDTSLRWAGVLEFTTLGDETFTIHPGDVLLAVDHTGSGHKWRLINDEPWKRAYVVFKEGADTHFITDQT